RYPTLALSAPLCTATTSSETYPLSLHDALPILAARADHRGRGGGGRPRPRLLVPDELHAAPRPRVVGRLHGGLRQPLADAAVLGDRKSTRLNSSHVKISYAVFCLKKKSKILAHE